LIPSKYLKIEVNTSFNQSRTDKGSFQRDKPLHIQPPETYTRQNNPWKYTQEKYPSAPDEI